jgi:hypothetical protein
MRLLRTAVLVLLFVPSFLLQAQVNGANVSANVLASTLLIQTSVGQGTGFTINVDGRQYLITAQHMVRGMGDEGTVQIAGFKNNQVVFTPLSMKIFRCAPGIDIAVLIPSVLLVDADTMDPVGGGSFTIGQNVYFVGFPFGKHSTTKQNPDAYGPIGLVKQAVISGVEYQPADDGDLIMLDGFNIGGFSGSPVTYWRPSGHSYVIGVISASIQTMALY